MIVTQHPDAPVHRDHAACQDIRAREAERVALLGVMRATMRARREPPSSLSLKVAGDMVLDALHWIREPHQRATAFELAAQLYADARRRILREIIEAGCTDPQVAFDCWRSM